MGAKGVLRRVLDREQRVRPDANRRWTNRPPAREPTGGVPEEAKINELSQQLMRQVLQPAMHQKLLIRVAELVAMGRTRGTAARDAEGQKVGSTSPQATSP